MKQILEPKNYKQNLIKGAKSKLFNFAKEMRTESILAEKMLWERLRRKGLGFKFRRQHPFGNFIPDFYCHKKMLAIELDGAIHYKPENKQYDFVRTEYLKEFGIYVLRFPNGMVERNIDEVVKIISKKLEEL